MADIALMEMIFIDSDDLARKTNMGAAMDTNAKTKAAFESYRQLGVDKQKATFLLDLHDEHGDLIDTICLNNYGFEQITGEKPKTEAEYRRIDQEFWAAVCQSAA